MIEAWFATSSGNDIPCLVPNDEIMEIASMIGLTASDLFRIDIPAGASRYARATVLVAGAQNISRLYASASFAPASALLRWREAQVTGATREMYMSLLPPRPLFQQTSATATNQQVYVVEAVDVRYWWNRAQTQIVSADNLFSQFFGSDGRWKKNELIVSGGMTCQNLLERFRTLLPIGTWDASAYLPHASLINRVAELNLTPECTLGLAVDMLLSQTGYILGYDFDTGQYEVVEINDDSTAINVFMSEYKRAAAGGLEAPSKSPLAHSDPVLLSWNLQSEMQVNRAPANVAMSFPTRAPEGATLYGNAVGNQAVGYSYLNFDTEKETAFWGPYTIPTDRTRLTGPAYILKEPRALTGKPNFVVNPDDIAAFGRTQNSLGVGWDFNTYIVKCREMLARRCSMRIGRVAWAGWPPLPNGAYRGTLLRYTLGVRNGGLVPYTLTNCDEDDWIFGPSGVPTTEPRDIVFSKGLAHARRLNNGSLQVDVAPPNTRVFPAKIKSATRLGTSGNAYWQWAYEWEEVETNPTAYTPPVQGSLQLARKSGTYYNAQNLMEAGNIYVGPVNPSNRIAGGVSQSDYLCQAIVEALPICNDTVVMMCEQFPTLYEDDTSVGPYPRSFWFSVPNAVKTTCYSCFTCTGDFGFFIAPSTLCDIQYGTFEAPENNADYGGFVDAPAD